MSHLFRKIAFFLGLWVLLISTGFDLALHYCQGEFSTVSITFLTESGAENCSVSCMSSCSAPKVSTCCSLKLEVLSDKPSQDCCEDVIIAFDDFNLECLPSLEEDQFLKFPFISFSKSFYFNLIEPFVALKTQEVAFVFLKRVRLLYLYFCSRLFYN